jgi:hypothetical protein
VPVYKVLQFTECIGTIANKIGLKKKYFRFDTDGVTQKRRHAASAEIEKLVRYRPTLRRI